jgi:amidase
VAPRDDEAVARLRAAGAIVLGKTNCPELMLAFETDNLVYGRTNNPYDLERTPGGSSGGEAAIVASAGSPLGLGSDSFGSIRVPAHFCGVAGIKPSHGRVPSTSSVLPTVGHIARLRSVGLLARTVGDLALALPLLCGPDGRDPWAAPVPLGDPAEVDGGSLRVAVHTDNGIAPPTPETAAAVRAAADALAGLGMPVVEARPPVVEQAGNALSLLEADGGAGPRRVLGMVGTTEVSPLLQAVLDHMQANARTTAELGGLLVWWDVFRAAMLGFMAEHDVIVCPVSAAPAPPHGTSLDGINGFSYAWTFNATGWPVVTLRAGTSPEGLPIGVQVVAPPWRDDVALAVAARLEPALTGWQAPPL